MTKSNQRDQSVSKKYQEQYNNYSEIWLIFIDLCFECFEVFSLHCDRRACLAKSRLLDLHSFHLYLYLDVDVTRNLGTQGFKCFLNFLSPFL